MTQPNPRRAEHAEATVQRVTDLYERWAKTAPPPGAPSTPLTRWWAARLAELHTALLPPDTPAPETPPSAGTRS